MNASICDIIKITSYTVIIMKFVLEERMMPTTIIKQTDKHKIIILESMAPQDGAKV